MPEVTMEKNMLGFSGWICQQVGAKGMIRGIAESGKSRKWISRFRLVISKPVSWRYENQNKIKSRDDKGGRYLLSAS